VIDTEVGANPIPKWTGKLCAVTGGDTVQYASFADHRLKNIRASSGDSMSFLQGR